MLYHPIIITPLPSLTPDLASQELRSSIAGNVIVVQVRRRNNQRALADAVARVAEHAQAVARVVGHLAVVLLVLGVAEEDGADNLVADAAVDVADGGGGEGGALAIRGQAMSACCDSARGDEERGAWHTCSLQRRFWRWGTCCLPCETTSSSLQWR